MAPEAQSQKLTGGSARSTEPLRPTEKQAQASPAENPLACPGLPTTRSGQLRALKCTRDHSQERAHATGTELDSPGFQIWNCKTRNINVYRMFNENGLDKAQATRSCPKGQGLLGSSVAGATDLAQSSQIPLIRSGQTIHRQL